MLLNFVNNNLYIHYNNIERKYLVEYTANNFVIFIGQGTKTEGLCLF